MDDEQGAGIIRPEMPKGDDWAGCVIPSYRKSSGVSQDDGTAPTRRSKGPGRAMHSPTMTGPHVRVVCGSFYQGMKGPVWRGRK